MKTKKEYNGLKSKITTLKQVNYKNKKYNVVIEQIHNNKVIKL